MPNVVATPVEDAAVAELRRENRRLRAQLIELRALREVAHRDPLTGLHNRRSCEQRLCEELARSVESSAGRGALLLVDLTGFKAVNDRFGHAAGDVVLCEIATVLEAASRLNDLCCRVGGDEFVILLPGASPDDARHAAERVRAGIRNRNLVASCPIHAAIGDASWPKDGTGVAAVIAAADSSMYADKHRSQAPVRTTRSARRHA